MSHYRIYFDHKIYFDFTFLLTGQISARDGIAALQASTISFKNQNKF